MVFSGLTFLLLFLPSLLILYFLSRDLKWRNGVLVVFSLVFYAWGEPVMVLLLLGTTLYNYLVALCMDRAAAPRSKKLWLALGTAGSLAGLLYFKYAGFFLTNLSDLLGIALTFNAPRLPIGISFYTFQILTYTVDVYRGKANVQKNFFRLLLYVSCFPQLIAGPIVQYADVAAAFPEYTVFVGGSSSFDMAPKPYDKYYALDRYCAEAGIAHGEALFVGDDYGVGGNDESVYRSDFGFLPIDDYRTFPDRVAYLL